MVVRHARSRRRGLLAAVLIGAVSLAGCARPAGGAAATTATPSAGGTPVAAPPTTTTAQGAPAAPLAECTAGTLRTRTAGVLTVATGAAPSSPWVIGSPADGQGLEAAIAVAVAQGLGFDAGSTRWVQANRAEVLAGLTGSFDLDLDRFSAAELAQAPVDASSGYFPDADAVLVPAGEQVAPALAALAPLRLIDVAADEPAVPALDGEVTAAATVPDPAAATAALLDGSADGVVLPLTDALAAAAADPSVRVLGQLPSGSIQPDQLVAVLGQGSPLTPCVSAVLDRMRVESTLQQLAQTWVPVPVLR